MKNTGSFHTLRNTKDHIVQSIRTLTPSTYVLRCSRDGLDFIPGQHLSVGPKNDLNMREYSIYSGRDEEFIEILIKEIEEGLVSKELRKLKINNPIKIEGPFGSFIIEDEDMKKPLYMIATGTGIAPFHCFSVSYPNLPFTVLHGVQTQEDLYEKETFYPAHINYIPCLSKALISDDLKQKTNMNIFSGRVTEYLKTHDSSAEGVYFLCGNCDMIYEAYDILHQKGVLPENIRAEVYF